MRRSYRFCAGLWSELVTRQELMRLFNSHGGLREERVLNVHMSVYTMHFCVPVNNSTALFTNHFHATSD